MAHELAQEEAVVDRAVGLEVVDVGEAQDVDVQGGLRQGRAGGSGTDREQRKDEREDADRALLRGSPDGNHGHGNAGNVTDRAPAINFSQVYLRRASEG